MSSFFMFIVAKLLATVASALHETSRNVYIRLTPLIGGPSNLRLHSTLLIEESKENSMLIGFDFLPLDAQSPATVLKLIMLQSCPGYVRELRLPRSDSDIRIGSTSSSIDDLRIAASTNDTNLHLLFNQCWQHTLDLANMATGKSLLDLVRDLATTHLRTSFISLSLVEKEEIQSISSADADEESQSISRAFAEEKARRFGRPLIDVLSDSYRQRLEASAIEFETELRRAEAEAEDR